jgi:hypothetical protein
MKIACEVVISFVAAARDADRRTLQFLSLFEVRSFLFGKRRWAVRFLRRLQSCLKIYFGVIIRKRENVERSFLFFTFFPLFSSAVADMPQI